ncbi:MAG: alpha/beta fold hydrolase [Methylobacteriaceae bacterium]|nr:alpha/beta fold hydrolase [Methylobacteriaceae bacterium]MBV9244676.1 alpha/beta fold hydrolase [Methylobacteriaceae bacterium]
MSRANLNGIDLHYQTVGSGEPLVLIHGLACGRRMWARQMRELGRSCKLIIYDQRGHGLSGAPDDPTLYSAAHLTADLIGLLDHLGIWRAHVLGFSLGGGPALALALRQPERVASLILSDVGSAAENVWKLQWLAARWIAMLQRDANELHDDMLRGDFYKTYANRGPRGRRHMRLLLATTPLPGLKHILAEVIAKRASLYRQKGTLAKISVPTLVLRGQQDYICLRATQLLAASIPGAEHIIIKGAGHMAPLEQPQAFNAAVLDFVARHSIASMGST